MFTRLLLFVCCASIVAALKLGGQQQKTYSFSAGYRAFLQQQQQQQSSSRKGSTLLEANKRNYGPSARVSKGTESVVSTLPRPVEPVVEKTQQVKVEVAPPVPIPQAVIAVPAPAPAPAPVPAQAQAQVPVPVPEKQPLSIDETLRLQVREEFASREKRLEELNVLQNQLNKSIQKKQEVEAVIVKEIESLRPRVKEELARETQRVEQLSSALKTFKTALASKTEVVETEQRTLVQMKDVRGKIKEAIILVQLDLAVKQKEELIEIEKGICNEIATCSAALESEITDTRIKLESMSSVVKSLPEGKDADAFRRYTWADVDSLQALLLSSLQASASRDEKVRSFANTFDNAMRKRGLVLGENTSISPTLAAISGLQKKSFAPSSSSASLRVVASTSSTSSTSKKIPSVTQEISALKVKSNEELANAAAGALKTTASGFVSVTANVLSASNSFFKSKEGAESQKAAALSVNAVKGVGSSFSRAFEAANKAWQTNFGNDDVPVQSTDEYMARVVKGFQGVISDKDLKQAINDIGSNAQKSTSEASLAASLLSKNVYGELSASDKWSNSLSEIRTGLNTLLSVFVVAGGRAAGEVKQSEMLPGSGPSDSSKQ